MSEYKQFAYDTEAHEIVTFDDVQTVEEIDNYQRMTGDHQYQWISDEEVRVLQDEAYRQLYIRDEGCDCKERYDCGCEEHYNCYCMDYSVDDKLLDAMVAFIDNEEN